MYKELTTDKMKLCNFLKFNLFLTIACLLVSFAELSSSSRRQEAVGPIQDSCVQNAREGNCQFYVCFSARHPCDELFTDNYALDYGWRFCSRFDSYSGRLTRDGQRWLNGTRMCAMERLLNYYRAAEVNCNEVDNVMKDEQASCEAENGICTGQLLSENQEVFTDVYSMNQHTATRFLHGLKHCSRTVIRQVAAWFRENVGQINVREILNEFAQQARQLRTDALRAFREFRELLANTRREISDTVDAELP